MFTGFLTGLVNGSNHIKYILLSNQKCMIQPILINLNRNEHSQEFYYYTFTVKLGRCIGNCNTLNDLSNKVCVPNKTEDLNLSAVNMITGINEPKTLRKHISCKLKCSKWKKNAIQINGGITINVDVSIKKFLYGNNIMSGILLHVIVKNGKYLTSIMDKIICDEIVDVKEMHFNKENISCKRQSFYIVSTFLLIIIIDSC